MSPKKGRQKFAKIILVVKTFYIETLNTLTTEFSPLSSRIQFQFGDLLFSDTFRLFVELKMLFVVNILLS